MPTHARRRLIAVGDVRRVMIRCPESGEAVPVGVHVSAAAFNNVTAQTVRCPHCGQEHTWSAKSAWTETIYVAAPTPAGVRPADGE
jgi:hypothetical protein